MDTLPGRGRRQEQEEQSHRTLKIEDSFMIFGRGLLLIPAVPLPDMSRFKPFDGQIIIRWPDGSRNEFGAKFLIEHFYMTSGGKLKLVLLLSKASKADAPEGSELIISADALAAIRAKTD